MPATITANISAITNAIYFELKEDKTLIYTVNNQGIAKYSNANSIAITVINYDSFFRFLPPAFIKGKEKCDSIVHDNNQQYILLDELTDTNPV